MFKKLLSNLPFNPSLIGQVAFYAKRMHRESALRRTGLVFVALAFFVQMFAFVSPSEPTLAASPNDILNGGFTTREDAVAKCRGNTQNFQDILNYYKLNCDILAGSETVYIRSTDYGNQLDSMGRTPQGPTILRTGKPTDEYAVNLPGGPYYMRNLWAWDSGAYSSYKVLRMTNTNGVTVMVMYTCGNLVTVGVYTPPPPPSTPPPPPPSTPPPPPVPPKTISCTNLVMNVSSGSKLAPGKPVSVRGQAAGQNLPSNQSVDMYYEMVDASNGSVVSSQQTLGVRFSGTTANDSTSHTFSSQKAGKYQLRLIVKYDSSAKTASGSGAGSCLKAITYEKICEEAKDENDFEACITRNKSARNSTQNIANANGTTANAGDVIQYTLTTKNIGKVEIKNWVIEENVSDLLEYADITDFHGGTLSSDKRFVRWPAITISPGASVTNQLTTKVKNPIPATPVSASNPGGSFDLVMTNVYGDTVNIKIAPPVIKTIENTTTLPNTGPGETLAAAFVITLVVTYFFSRSRLMAKELDIVRADYANTGGV